MTADRTTSPTPVEGEVWLHVADGIATLRLGAPEESVVTLTRERLESLERAVEELAGRNDLRGVVITGPGPGMFAAGADIRLIEQVQSVTEGTEAAVRGRTIFAGLRALSCPVVAAIEGPCLGGGLELALFCDVRVASAAPSTRIGLPEVKLGILTGFGGTQNLTRLIGLPKALDWILRGRTGDARTARRAGIVDRVVPEEKLLTAAREELDALAGRGRKAPRRRLRGSDRWLSLPPLRALVARKARKNLQEGPARFYDAPRRALELCLLAGRVPEDEGFQREATALGELIVSPTSKGLVHLYFLTERAKKHGRAEGAADLDRAFVLGGGVMGAGIAGLFAQNGLRVRLCDLDGKALARAKARLQKSLDKRVRRRRMAEHDARAVQDRLAAGTDWGSLAHTDLWLEAVVEDPDLKHRLMTRAVEQGLPGSAVIATNTSSLSIDRMADAVPRPERVVGIHFFNPPEKMPLVEVIRGARTDAATVATACRLAVRLGKFPVVVGDRPGFLVNRCLAPYLNEAATLMLEGNGPRLVDRVMLDFGMPMGPARLLDEVGWDVAAKVSDVLHEAFPERMPPSPLCRAMVAAGHLGTKAGGGLYGPRGRGSGPGLAVLKEQRNRAGLPQGTATRSEVLERLVYRMVDEAFRCLDEGLVGAEEDLDLGLVMGIGFPPFTGGISRWARREGIARIVERLEAYAVGAPRFAPGPALRRRAGD